eukprot:103265_1
MPLYRCISNRTVSKLRYVRVNYSIHYTQRRGGAISNFFTNKLSLGYKIRGIKSREDFKPKGVLVYKSSYVSQFKFLAIGSSMFAISFTFAGMYDYIYPIEFFAQNYFVMFVGGVAGWMIPLFIIPSFGRRFITRIWLENNWWMYIESHSRMGNIRHTRVPIGFARIPPQQFKTMKGLRKYIMGIKLYNEWGYYYLRRSGRFCDAKALQIMFGDEVMSMLDEQKLIKPISLPPQIMDNILFPPTNYKQNEIFEAAKSKYNPMPMEEGFFSKFKFWKILRENRLEKKKWKQKEKLLLEWKEKGKTNDEIILLLKDEGLLDVENRKLIGKEEFGDFRNRNKKSTILKQHPIFKKLLIEKNEIYSKFKDLEWFTVREIGIMKEYDQIGIVQIDSNGKTVIDYKNDPLIVNKNNVPKGISKPQNKFEDYKNMTQKQLHEIYEGNYPITVPEKGNFLRMKPEKEAEKHKETTKRFIEWKRDLDKRAQNQIKKMENNWEIINNKIYSGYAMSSHAIEEKYDREGLIITKTDINRERKKKGVKYWKRYMGNTFRPRRSSTKRWNHMYDKRMVFGKVKRRGKYTNHTIKYT